VRVGRTPGLGRIAAGALFAMIACLAPLHARRASAQDTSVPTVENADTVFVTKVHQPISYLTSYDRNVSRGEWFQSLNYNQTTNRVAFGVNAGLTTIDGIHGLENNGLEGDIQGHLDWRTTQHWLWTLEGRFGGVSNQDNIASTNLRQNRLQLRTQYTVNPWKQLTATGIVFAEIEQDQSIGIRSAPRDTLVDTTFVPTQIYASHTRGDSSYSSGIRNGLNGSATWKPLDWMEARAAAIITRVSTTTNTTTRDFWAPNPGEGATLQLTAHQTSTAPNGNDQYETHLRITKIPKGTLEFVLRDRESDQSYYALTLGGQEHLSITNRTGTFHLEQSPFRGAQLVLDGTLGHLLQEYTLQNNLTSQSNTQNLTGVFAVYHPENRASLGFQFGKTRNDKQRISPNGTVINRSLNASGMHRMTNRLWLDANSSISLFSTMYDDKVSDQDNVKGFANVGGGYRIAATCSTTVHFSVNRAHSIAINENSSGGNNVQTTYQMDASLRLQATPTFLILQNYQINANYQIYDYDEPRNTLSRIRRVDTILQDSLFSFASVKLVHNFFFQDRGPYASFSPDESRIYYTAQQIYQQNLGATLGLTPTHGLVLYATQSLANTRTYSYNPPAPTTTRNRWGLTFGANLDRDLSGNMALHGTIQHIGEYTETPAPRPSLDPVSYWVAGVTFTKDF